MWQRLIVSQQAQNICMTFVQRRSNVFDVGPTLYKCFVFAGLVDQYVILCVVLRYLYLGLHVLESYANRTGPSSITLSYMPHHAKDMTGIVVV